jgi:hypothetical protein
MSGGVLGYNADRMITADIDDRLRHAAFDALIKMDTDRGD